VTVVAPLREGRLDEARAMLEEAGKDPAANALIPFAGVEGVHYARLFLVEPAIDLKGRPIPAQLVFMADFDAPAQPRLERLVARSAAGWTRLLACCEGFTSSGGTDAGACLAFVRRQAGGDAAYYVNTVGLGAAQAVAEARLRDAIEDRLDAQPDLLKASPAGVRDKIRDWIQSSDELSWAISPPAPPSLGWRLGELAHLVLVALGALVLLPLAIVLLPFWLLALRLHERSDPAPDVLPDPHHAATLAALEDHGPVNQFTAIGFLKPGPFRAFTARLILFLIAYGVRHVFNRANLAGVKTIHFARWTFIDGGRRVIFASNYDGSVESYMDDFIDKVGWGLNAVFSNGLGYPPTQWLLWGGAHHELAFKHYLRVHQVPTQVWYAAYPSLSALNIANNAAIRLGVSGSTEAGRWLQRL